MFRVLFLSLVATTLLVYIEMNCCGDERGQLRFTQERLLNINVDILEGCLATEGKYPVGNNIRTLLPLAQKMLMNWKSEEYRKNWYRDGWGNELRYVTSADGLRYVLASPGKNGKFEEDIESYLWKGSPYQRAAFGDNDSNDDSITTSNCDMRAWEGMGRRCLLLPSTRLTLMNIRDALRVHFQVYSRYPRTIDVHDLQRLIRQETRLPYELFGGNSDYPITYIVSSDQKKYILAADWYHNEFNIDLRKLLQLDGKELEIAASHLSENAWVYHTGKLISSWPE